MGDKHIIVPALYTDVKFVGFDVHNAPIPSDSTKVKLVDVHPSKSLMVSVDGDGKVVVWDYSLKIELCSALAQDIFNVAPAAPVLPQRSHDSYIKSRLSHRSQMSTMCRMDHILNHDYCAAITAPSEPAGAKPRSNVAPTIRQINFCDAAAIEATCYSAGKHAIHQPSLHSSNALLIVSDTAVVMYDYLTKKGQVLTEAELTKPPASAEMLYHSCCAIGCTDGSIRLWDMKTNEVARTLSAHARGAVVVKAIPIKSDHATSSTTEAADRVRLLSVGADGTAFLWDMHMCIGATGALLIDSEGSGSSPSARLKDMPASAGLARNHIHYDCETNLISISITESKIKLWDMSDMVTTSRSSLRSAHHVSNSSAGSSSSLRNKRLSVMSMVNVGGGGGGAGRDQFDHIPAISCVGSMKPGEKKDKKVEVAGFAPLGGAQFTSDSFLICSKTNVLGIYKSREASMADDRSERSSVMGGTGNEKSTRMQLLHEFNISSLLLKYVETNYPTLFLPEPLKEVLRTGGVKVYTLKVSASQPHLWVLGTSVGLLLLSLNTSMNGSLCATHPMWSNLKLMFVGNTLRKVLLDTPSLSGGAAAADNNRNSLRRVPSGRSSFNDDASTASGAAALHPELDVAVEVIGELSISDSSSASSAAAAAAASAPQPKRLSFAPSTKKAAAAGAGAADAPTCRPVLHVSPSGEYCALHFADTLLYLVVKVDPYVRARKDLIEVDRGYALEFAWVGTRDCYLIKTASFIATQGAKKRASIMNLMAAAEKEVSRLHLPHLVLWQCRGDARAERVPFVCETLHQAFFNTAAQITTAVHLHGGPLVAVTTERKYSEVVVVKNPAAAAAAGAASETSGDPAAAAASAPAPASAAGSVGVLVSDVDKAERDIKYAVPPAKSQLVTRFFCLVPLSEARRLEAVAAAAAANEAAGRTGGKTKKQQLKSGIAASEDATATPAPAVSDDGTMSLVPVGPTMKCVDAVRWDPTSGYFAVLHSESDDVSILRLNAEQQLSVRTVGRVSVGPSLPLSRGLSDLTWTPEGVLYCARSSVVSAIVCTNGSSNDPKSTTFFTVLTLPYAAPLLNARPSAVLRPSHTSSDFTPLPWSQVIGYHGGSVYVYFRDGSVRKLGIAAQPALAVGLLVNGINKVTELNETEKSDLLKKWVDTVNVSEQQAVQTLLDSQ